MEHPSKLQREEMRKERAEIRSARNRRRRLKLIVARVAMLILAGIGVVATTVGLVAYAVPDIQKTALIAAIAFASVFGASIIILRQYQDSLRETLEDIRDANETQEEAIAKQLRDGLASARTPLPSIEDVAQSAADLLSDFRVSLTNNRGQKLVYLGATANLLSVPGESEDTRSPFAAYHDEQSQLTQKEAYIERYIALLPKPSFADRGERFRSAYLQWLSREITLLENNPNYWFYDVPRAYRWGGMTSHIFGPDAALEILGGSRGGAVMKGDAAVRQYLNQLLEHINMGESNKQRMSAAGLRKYRDSLLHDNRPKTIQSGGKE